MRIGGLDLLRCVCAMAVFLFHALYLFVMNGHVPWTSSADVQGFAQYGYLGVQVFFMISGYVIPMSVAGKSRVQFFLGRAARLMPAFWMCLALTALALLLAGTPPTGAQFAANLAIVSIFFGQPYLDGVYWSLTAEIIFYSWIFAMAGNAGFAQRLRIFALLWLSWSVTDFCLDLPGDGLSNSAWAPYFAIGIFIFLDQNGGLKFDRIMALASAFIAAVFAWKQANALPYAAISQLNPLVVAAVIIVMAAVVFIVVRIPMQGRGLNFAMLCGAISYPLYLIHAEFGSVLLTAIWRINPVLTPTGVVIVFYIAYLVTRAEKPMAKAIRKLA